MVDRFTSKMKGTDWLAHSILTRLFKYRDIAKDDSLYLRRFFIIRKGRLKLFLHNIRRSDSDRHPHDHPWDFTTLCISGGYVEEMPGNRKRIFTPGMVFQNKAEHTHRVRLFHDEFENVEEKTTWTFIHTSKARRVWGFLMESGWVDWRTYLDVPQSTPEALEDTDD